MEYNFFIILLFIVWAIFWSFASVLIYRIKSKEWWILFWRSHCKDCNKILSSLDLIPIFSWIISKWKCRHCKKKVSSIYPFLEISTAFLFSLIWIFLIDFNQIFALNIIEITKLIFFLIIWFFTIIYIFYDILFLEIPEPILIIWIVFILVILSIQSVFPSFHIIENIVTWNDYWLLINLSAITLAFISIAFLYLIMLKWLKEYIDIIIIFWIIIALIWFKYLFDIELKNIAILNWLIGTLWIFIFFFLQYLVWIILSNIEKKKKKEEYKYENWIIWWWDLRIAILIGLVLWTSLSVPGLMIVYLVWSIISISLIILWKLLKNKENINLASMVPFWPFLWIWFFITLFYQNEIIYIIERYFII